MAKWVNRTLLKPGPESTLGITSHSCSACKGFKCTQEEEGIPQRQEAAGTAADLGPSHRLRPVGSKGQQRGSRGDTTVPPRLRKLAPSKEEQSRLMGLTAWPLSKLSHAIWSPRCYALRRDWDKGWPLPFQASTIPMALRLLFPVFQSHCRLSTRLMLLGMLIKPKPDLCREVV